jgi:hypothetical protein
MGWLVKDLILRFPFCLPNQTKWSLYLRICILINVIHSSLRTTIPNDRAKNLGLGKRELLVTPCVTESSWEASKWSLRFIFEKSAVSKLKLTQKRENHIRDAYQICRQLNRRRVNMIDDSIEAQRGFDRLWNRIKIKMLKCNLGKCKILYLGWQKIFHCTRSRWKKAT